MKPLDLSRYAKLQKPKKRTKDRQPTLIEQKPNFARIKKEIQETGKAWCECGRRLYWTQIRELYCRNSIHSFFLPRQTVEDILSDKLLNDYKQHRKSLLK